MPRPRKTETSAKTTKIAKAATTRAKADVSSAFEEVKKDTLSAELVDLKLLELLKNQQEEVEKTAAGMNVDKTVQGLATLGLSIQRALDQVKEDMSSTLGDLQTVSNAVEIKKQELLALHEIDVAATSVQNLVSDYDAKSTELEAKVNAEREGWRKEQADHARLLLERNAEADKARKREQEEYDYKTARDRAAAQDKFEEGLQKRAKEVKEKEEQMLREWQRREADLKEKETEFAEMKKQIETMPAAIKAEVSKAEAVLRNVLTKDFQNVAALNEKQYNSDVRVLELRVESLRETVAQKDILVAGLQEQLRASNAQVQKIATEAFESVSGKQALSVATQLSQNQAAQSSQKK
ncbi:MAG TPA: hypothetical protein VMX17_14495 [Candidatus Glassbacteria bacterium]|nr:hypothetical protein [Candidatus Glassbacteria bacterium]